MVSFDPHRLLKHLQAIMLCDMEEASCVNKSFQADVSGDLLATGLRNPKRIPVPSSWNAFDYRLYSQACQHGIAVR